MTFCNIITCGMAGVGGGVAGMPRVGAVGLEERITCAGDRMLGEVLFTVIVEGLVERDVSWEDKAAARKSIAKVHHCRHHARPLYESKN